MSGYFEIYFKKSVQILQDSHIRCIQFPLLLTSYVSVVVTTNELMMTRVNLSLNFIHISFLLGYLFELLLQLALYNRYLNCMKNWFKKIYSYCYRWMLWISLEVIGGRELIKNSFYFTIQVYLGRSLVAGKKESSNSSLSPFFFPLQNIATVGYFLLAHCVGQW